MNGTGATTKVNEIFYRPISREINEVVKVDNDDPELVKQELEEYILTPQLENHFSDVLDNIRETEHNPTEDVGIWISGFFGSGKSHFMKMLGYLLENEQLPDGSTAADKFKARTQDEMLRGAVNAVNQKFDSELLMFQIGAKADATDAESITEIVHREFNTERGYASLPWVAKLEQDLEQEGRYEAFKEAIETEKGEPWEEVRTRATFLQADVKKALVECTPDFDEDDAQRAIDDVKESVVITPSSLTEDILEYVERREAETGEDCRYFVFIDEISQFIGEDDDKLLELQSLVEEFGRQGQDKLWLGVTSQEELQELIPGVLAQKLEESKVGDRFPHRYDLISDNLDQVVRDRILQKGADYVSQIENLYADKEGILSARYKLDSGRSLKPINSKNFVACYPFLPYQLDILPDIFAALRGRGSDDRLTGRERTLIDVTQSVLKDDDLLYDSELGAIVTLDLIFDEIKEEVPDADVRSIENASPEGADSELARRVLKSLYLLQQLDWIPNTAENVATTLQGELGATQELEAAVEEALEGLVDAGYVGRGEDGYRFLRETERELENDIKAVDIKAGDIRRFSKRFLTDIFDDVTTISYEGQPFDITVETDEETLSSKGYIFLNAYSPLYQLYEDVSDRTLKTQSHSQEDTIYWIADTEKAADIEDGLERIQQIEQVLREKRGKELSQEEREAIGQKEEDLSRLRNEIERALKNAFRKGDLIYYGSTTDLDEMNARLETIVQEPVKEAIPRVFTNLKHGLANIKDRHIDQVFGDLENSSNPAIFEELSLIIDGSLNPEARIASELVDEIKRRDQQKEDRTGDDLIEYFKEPPYGWSRDVVRLAAAVLFRNRSIVPTYQERTYESYTEDGAKEIFTQISKFRKASFDERETADPKTRNAAKQILDRLFDKKVKRDPQEVANGIRDVIETWTNKISAIKPRLERCNFPLLSEVEEFETYLRNIKQQPTTAKRIQTFVDLEDDLEPVAKTTREVQSFADDDRLEKYATYRQFIQNEWPTLVEEAEKNPQLLDVSDSNRESAERLEGILDSDEVIAQWTDADTEYQTVAQAYTSVYESLYEERHELYQAAIDRVKAYAGDDLDESALREALQPLTEKTGDASLSLNIDEKEHINRDPSITRLVEHIQTVESYETQAKQAVDEKRPEDGDGPVRKQVNLDDFFGDVVITEDDDLDEPIEKVRAEVEQLLGEDEDVEIRFS